MSGKIAFASDRDGNQEIYSVDFDGSDPIRLTDNDATDTGPQFSPDGSKILFESTRDGDPELYVMDADGSAQTRLTVSPGYDVGGTWSPDGKHVAFASARADGNWDIYSMNVDGTEITRLTDNPGTDSDPAWSPDGTEIVFWSSRTIGVGLFKMRVDGTDVTQLTNSINDNAPDWSPSGQKIVFSSARDGNFEIYVMEADGSGLTRLTYTAAIDFHPSFAPDGKQIAWWHFDGQSEIFVMNADGTSATNITNNAAEDIVPSWGPAPRGADTTPPVIDAPHDFTVEATGPAGAAVSYTVTAADDVDPNPIVDCAPTSGQVFPLGSTAVTCTAIDASGNGTTASFAITVVDTTSPTIGLPDNQIANATEPDGARVFFTVAATDTVDLGVTAICSPPSGTVFPIGTATVVCTTVDDAKNSAHGSFTIRVKGAAEQIADLAVAATDEGPGTSLADKAGLAQAYLTAGDIGAVCKTLVAFSNEVRAQADKSVPPLEATALLVDAARIQDVVGCRT